MKNEGFREKLAKRQKETDSLVTVGLDPLEEKIPYCLRRISGETSRVIEKWMCDIVDSTAPLASMFKLQRGHYEALVDGEKIMRSVILHIKTNHPQIPIFVDCKRGDISRTQMQYRKAHFCLDGADGINFNPYMGMDCMEALIDSKKPGKALVGLCYTSNESSREIQNAWLASGERLWEYVARQIFSWAKTLDVLADAGLVMAAAHEKPARSGRIYSYHLEKARQIVEDKMWFLIPGIGTQGGFIAETIAAGYCGYGSVAINSSSGIIFASEGIEYAQAAAQKTEALRDQLRRAI